MAIYRNSYYPAFFLLLCSLLLPDFAAAQCTNWSISTHLVSSSTCAGNGTFNVTVSGPDAINLTGLSYGIPTHASGFSVPLNSSPNFSGIPAGTFTVSAVATCGGNFVGKNTSVTMPGNYKAPNATVTMARGTPTCGDYGRISVSIENGRGPYRIQITSAPGYYTGPVTFTSPMPYYTIDGLKPGSYTVQVIDACGNGTTPKTATVTNLDGAYIPFMWPRPLLSGISCTAVSVNSPFIGNGAWDGYSMNDFTVSVQISGGVSARTPFYSLSTGSATVPLLSGKTLKDCYGKNITYTIRPVFCGADIIINQPIPHPGVATSVAQNCNVDFTAAFNFSDLLCQPVTFTYQNSTGTIYGPYTTSGSFTTPPSVPGNYTLNYTSADGYSGSSAFATIPVTGNPYRIQVLRANAAGYNNGIFGFKFATSNNLLGAKTVELFSGPAGYSYSGSWNTDSTYYIEGNGSPSPGKILFPAGNYIWKITDNCGSYFLPVTVGPDDLFQFTIRITDSTDMCNGRLVNVAGTATSNGRTLPFKYVVSSNTRTDMYNAGQPALLTKPGRYIFVPFSDSLPYVKASGEYPDGYTVVYEYNYAANTTGIDINHTQGFLCLASGSAAGGKIYTAGMGGIPFKYPAPHYNYYLADSGMAQSGRFLAGNTTGVFTGFGGTANKVYDVKVVDSCGAFSIQQVKILNLDQTRLISSSNYVACAGNDVLLSALYLPGATYSWSGPGGFTSTLRTPLITAVNPANIGIYRVTIRMPDCNLVTTDSTTVTMNGNPPKPLISVSCFPFPPHVTVTNPSSGITYKWKQNMSVYWYPFYYSSIVPSDSGYTKISLFIESTYQPIATDTTTGCSSYGDSVHFAGYNNTDTLFRASVYSSHLSLCTGDSTTLVAKGATSALSYQWFKNGVVIPGANSVTYTTNTPGNYKVRIDAGQCALDTSAEVTVIVIPIPTATITAPVTQMCPGDTLLIQSNTGTGYTYNWLHDGNSIPGAFSPVLKVTGGGSYSVVISNGGCVRISPPVTINMNPTPDTSITPSVKQVICNGDSVLLSIPYKPGYVYGWERNGIILSGATGNSFYAKQAGDYRAYVSNTICPKVRSALVTVNVALPGAGLGNDTIVCASGPFSIPLSVNPTFTQVLWSTGENTQAITVTAPGTYWVRAINTCGTYTDTINIATNNDYLMHLPDDTLICNADGAFVYSVPVQLKNIHWSTGDTLNYTKITQPGTYWVSGESLCGLLTDTMRVQFCKPVIRAVTLPATSICAGDCIEPKALIDNYPKQIRWLFPGARPDSSDQLSPGTVCYPDAGNYQIRLIAENAGGSVVYTNSITVYPKPVPRFKDSSLTISYKTSTVLPACADGSIISWYKNGELICSNCPALTVRGQYFSSQYVCVISNGSCSDSCTYKMKVIDIPHDIWLPDAFTPNGDGRNDIFRIVTDNPNVYAVDLYVYNRWGQQVHVGHNRNDGWDGTVNSKPADMGTYVWMIRYKILGSDEVFFKKGDVQLIR